MSQTKEMAKDKFTEAKERVYEPNFLISMIDRWANLVREQRENLQLKEKELEITKRSFSNLVDDYDKLCTHYKEVEKENELLKLNLLLYKEDPTQEEKIRNLEERLHRATGAAHLYSHQLGKLLRVLEVESPRDAEWKIRELQEERYQREDLPSCPPPPPPKEDLPPKLNLAEKVQKLEVDQSNQVELLKKLAEENKETSQVLLTLSCRQANASRDISKIWLELKNLRKEFALIQETRDSIQAGLFSLDRRLFTQEKKQGEDKRDFCKLFDSFVDIETRLGFLKSDGK